MIRGAGHHGRAQCRAPETLRSDSAEGAEEDPRLHRQRVRQAAVHRLPVTHAAADACP